MTRIIISGASGAIGTRLVNDLIKSFGNKIDLICLFRSRNSQNAFLNTLVVDAQSKVECVLVDLTSTSMIDSYVENLSKFDPTIGIHCAADVSWDKSLDQLYAANVQGAINFARIIEASSDRASLIYISTAYTAVDGWTYQNGYEESKALAERKVRDAFTSMPISTFSCSLVVGDSIHGEIARYNGIYPLLRFLAFYSPPFLVGDNNANVDIVPVDWVSMELVHLVRHHMNENFLEDVVAASGENNLTYRCVVDMIMDELNLLQNELGRPPRDIVAIIKSRQWQFLKRSMNAWKLKNVSRKELKYLEHLLVIYGGYTESVAIRPPKNLSSPAPDPKLFFPNVVQHWVKKHRSQLLGRLSS